MGWCRQSSWDGCLMNELSRRHVKYWFLQKYVHMIYYSVSTLVSEAFILLWTRFINMSDSRTPIDTEAVILIEVTLWFRLKDPNGIIIIFISITTSNITDSTEAVCWHICGLWLFCWCWTFLRSIQFTRCFERCFCFHLQVNDCHCTDKLLLLVLFLILSVMISKKQRPLNTRMLVPEDYC